jgi:hypothetical protein
MRIAHRTKPDTETIVHQGATYQRDEHGGFDMPDEVAYWFLKRFPRHYVEAEPIPLPPPVRTTRGPGKSRTKAASKTQPEREPEDEPEDEDPEQGADSGEE